MTLYTIFLFIHLISLSYFAGFIFLDRLFFRRFFIYTQDRIAFYQMAKRSLLMSSIIITLSGVGLLFLRESLSLLLYVKILFALILFYLFFSCPKWQAKLSKTAALLYRATVVILLLIVMFLALNL